MSVFSFISGIFKPAADLVDELVTSDEEKLQIKKQLREIENKFQEKILDYEAQLLEKRSDIVKAEATGQSWLQRSWRPITMLTFLVLVVCNSFGLLVTPLADEAWTLLQIGLGGYVVGRSAEKVVSQLRTKSERGAKG
jgi:hypothetical protein